MLSTRRVGAALVALYSAALLLLEWRTTQQEVRPYFTDLEGPVLFYGVNTTLSVALLWGTGLLCTVALFLRGEERPWLSRGGRFLLSQIAFFAALGLDDRFMIHERMGGIVGFNDAWLLLATGVAELLLLLWYRSQWNSPAARRWLLGAALSFGVMTVVDGLIPAERVLRLSVEDLSKTWSGFFLFLFGWELVRLQLARREVGA